MRCRLLHGRVVAVISALFLILIRLQPAAADIGPGSLYTADGSSIVPGAQTQVRMEDERVEINVQAAINETGKDASFALVTALFNMRNLGEISERMKVKFPLNDGPVAGMSGDEIKCFQAWVNEEPAEITFGEEPSDLPVLINARWAYFNAIFPPGELVPIRVSYVVQPQKNRLPEAGETRTTQPNEPEQTYDYTLVTGRGWKDTIGCACEYAHAISRV